VHDPSAEVWNFSLKGLTSERSSSSDCHSREDQEKPLQPQTADQKRSDRSSALGGDLGGIEPRKIILPKRTSIYRELHQNRSSKVSKLSFFRVVAMMWAPASAAMLRAARPKAEVAPLITRVWPSLISKLRCRHVQAVAYDSGITANSSHDQGQCLAMGMSFSERKKNLFAGHLRRDFLSSRA